MLLKVVRSREPASFWRENMVAVVILLRIFAHEVTDTSFCKLEVLTFCDREMLLTFLVENVK